MSRVIIIISVFIFLQFSVFARVPVGVNLPQFSPSSTNTQAPFCDIFKYGQTFTPSATSDKITWGYSSAKIELNAYGLPLGISPSASGNTIHVASTLLGPATGIKNSLYELGIYHVRFQGAANVWFSGAGVVVLQSERNYYRVNLTSAESFLTVRIGNLTDAGGIRNFTVYRDQRDCVGSFRRDFVDKLQGVDVLRFAGWQNEKHIDSWFSRNWTKTASNESIQMIQEGVSVSYMVELANLMNTSPWFSAPAKADEQYLTQFANYVVLNLKPQLPIIVEWSNEVSFGSFGVQVNMSRMALRVWRTALGENLNVPYDRNNSRVKIAYSAAHIEYPPHIFAAMDKVPESIPEASYLAIIGTFCQDLGFRDNNYVKTAINRTKEELYDLVRQSSLQMEIEYHRLVSYSKRKMDIDLIAYRGGCFTGAASYGSRNTNRSSPTAETIELAKKEQELENVLIEINRDLRMKDLLIDFANRWEKLGGGLYVFDELIRAPQYCNVTTSRECGSFALMESNSDILAPKFQAFQNYLNGIPSSLPFAASDPYEYNIPCNQDGCVWGICNNGTCECFNGYSGKNCSLLGPKNSDCSKVVGINLAGVVDYSPEWVFVDLFKHSREWISQLVENYGPWSTEVPIDLNENGYPKSLKFNQAIGAMMVRDLRGHYPSGIYTVLWEGEGIVDCIGFDAKVLKRWVGKMLLNVNASLNFNNGIFIRIERTNPQNPIRNIRVIMPGFERRYKNFPFHPFYLKSIEKYSVLRFMDWANTNNPTSSEWIDRKLPNYRTMAGLHGVALEYMVLLSNMVGANPWFCIPINASENYIHSYAQFIKQNLRPDLTIYVEVANEVWNLLFWSGQFAMEEGIKRNMSTDGVRARLCYYAWKSKQVFQIFKDVFGPEQRYRLKFVVSTQSVQTAVSDLTLECFEVWKEADHLASGPYFGYTDSVTNGTGKDKDVLSLDELFNYTVPKAIDESLSYVKEQYQTARKWNLTLIAYESGQSFLGAYGPQTDRLIELNRDKRMYNAYMKYNEGLRKSGIELIVHYSSVSLFTQYGFWGLMEGSDQRPSAVAKYKAIQDFIELEKNRSVEFYEGKVSVNFNYSTSIPAVSNFCKFGFPNSFENGRSCLYNCSKNGLCGYDGQCACYFGYSGADCSIFTFIDKFECGYKCTFDQGICKPQSIDSESQIRYWGCECYSGWTGLHCSIPVCPSKCSYAGRCSKNFTCSCFDGFLGNNCEIDCGCAGHGKCKSDQTCNCDPGFKWNSITKKCEFDCKCNSMSQKCIGPNECSCANNCIHGSCLNGTCSCWNGFGGQSCDIRVPAPNDDAPMGMNLAGIADWSTEWPFVDLFKTSRDWISQYYPGWDTTYIWNNQFPQNRSFVNGYPLELKEKQILSTTLCRDVEGHCPNGTYVCLWDGDGFLSFGMDAKIIRDGKNRLEFVYQGTRVRDNGIYISILETNPRNPIRNIRVLMPGHEYTHERFPFHPLYLKKLSAFSTLRFMQWNGGASAAVPSSWNLRKTTQYFSQARDAEVSWEYVISLSNNLAANAWISIPLLADDDYIQNLAIMLRENLRNDSLIYVEYSNEVWNDLFDSGKYASSEGLKLGFSTNQYTARYRYNAHRSKQIFQIFKSVFAAQQRHRLKFVLSAWTISVSATREILEWEDAYKEADHLAVAVYMDCGGLGDSAKAAETSTKTVSQIFTSCFADMSNLERYMKNMINLANSKNISVIGYEFGPGLVEYESMVSGYETPGLTALFIQANRDYRMRSLYFQLLNMSHTLGIHEIMHFCSIGKPTKYGSWGLWEYQDQLDQDSPKFMGLEDFNRIFYVNRTISISMSAFKLELNSPATLIFSPSSVPQHAITLQIFAEGCTSCVRIDPSQLTFTEKKNSSGAVNVTLISPGLVSLSFRVSMDGDKPWGIPLELSLDAMTTSIVPTSRAPSVDESSAGVSVAAVVGASTAAAVLVLAAAALVIHIRRKRRELNMSTSTNTTTT